jgi:hypothetical protein
MNKGECGVCGDPVNKPKPRPHEAGGQYAKGIIARRYSVGQVRHFYVFHLLPIADSNIKNDTCQLYSYLQYFYIDYNIIESEY